MPDYKAIHHEVTRERLKMEARWIPIINRALRKQITPVITFLKQFGPVQTLAMLDSLMLQDPVRQVLYQLYRSVGVEAGNNEYGRLLKAYPEGVGRGKAFGFNRFLAAAMDRFFTAIGAHKVVSITETERNRVRAVLRDGLEEQLTIDEYARRLRAPAITKTRARVISRAEVGAAQMQGGREGAKQSRLILVKRWFSAQNDRTRRMPRNSADHLHMNGKEVEMDGMFQVPSKDGTDLLMQPCDPNGPADQVIQCRCTVAYVPKRGPNGRPLRR